MKFEKATRAELEAGMQALEESCENRFCFFYDEWKPIKCKMVDFWNDFNMEKCICRNEFNAIIDRRKDQAIDYISDCIKGGKQPSNVKLVDMMDCRLNKESVANGMKEAFANDTLTFVNNIPGIKNNLK